MLAGYETTSNTLSYVINVLIKHPEEQQKLYEEIEAHYGDGSVSEINAAISLIY